MNKKLIASLLTLGLVLSPVSGAVSESYATEVSTLELNKDDMASLIKAYIEDFEHTKESSVYNFAGVDAQNNLSKAINDAKEIIIKASPSADKLKDSISSIETAYKSLAEKAKANVDADAINKDIKTNLLKIVKLLEKHGDKAEDPKYKEGLALVDKAKEQLETENLKNAKLEDLLKLDQDLIDFFTNYKKELADEEEFNPSEDEINAFEANLDKTKYENIKADYEALAKSYEDFLKSDKFILASDGLKKAYKDAYEELEKHRGIDKATYEDIAKAVKNLADAKYNIDSQATDYKYIENKPSSEDILKKLSAYVKESKATLDGLKDIDLESKYKAAIAKAIVYKTSHENGIKRDLKDYQELEAQLKDLTEKINKAKNVKAEPKEENKKLDKLKSSIEKGNKFFYSDAYDKADKDKRDKFLKALVEAEALKKKYDENPALVKDEEIEKATKALDDALAGFDKFSDKDKARDAIKGLLGLTKGIKIEQIYDTKDTKEAKEAYTKAREKAAKLADDKKASLEDLDKAYKDFNESVVKLAEFLTSRLQKLVDDDKTFRESDKYKDAEKDSKKEEAIKNYKKLVEDGEKELKKAAPDANILNVLYKKLMNARDEINGVIKTSWGRKLADAILDYEILKVVPKYNPRVGALTGERKKAADFYTKYLAAAKELKKAGKLDSQDAKDLLDLINHARDFIEGNITEKQYLINFYYHNLKALRDYKNQEEFKKLPQALRDKLNKALDFYNESSDEDAVFSALDAVWQENEIQALIDKIKAENDPNNARNNLLIKLREMAEKSDEFIKDDKYKNAPKELRADYDRALEAAKKVLGAEKPTEKEVKDAYDGLKLAIDRIETRSIIDRRLVVLAENFKKNQLKIANPADRQAIADKINALKKNPYTTIEEVDAVEKELNDLINPKFAATQTLVPQSQVPTTSRPISTVTNPGSIVKTGINGIAKVAVVLVAALGIFILTSKKGDKNENN